MHRKDMAVAFETFYEFGVIDKVSNSFKSLFEV